MTKLIIQIFLFTFFVVFSYSLKIHLKNNHKTLPLPKFALKQTHNFYNIEETDRISNSQSIKNLNQCKDLCLQMHQIFPFQFKYHRLIYRQPDGLMKYIAGECLYTFKSDGQQNSNSNKTTFQKQNHPQNNQKVALKEKKWFPWGKLKAFVDLSTVQDQLSTEQKKAWLSYSKDCQDEELKLSESSRVDFKFTLVHSDFQYYENQRFANLSPFDDLDQLMDGLSVPGMI